MNGIDLALFALAAAVVILVIALALVLRRSSGNSEQSADMEAQLAALARAQDEMTGRVKTMTDVIGGRQAELARAVSERLDGLGHRIGQSMTETTKNTQDTLSRLAERLAVIDTAQRNITELSGRVVELQQVLADKQTRGAFGQGRMEAIISDGLPSDAYAFQATLSNGKRPDCLVRLPGGAGGLVIDAKFPLEGWNAIRTAVGPDALKAAQAQFRRDILTHIKAIRERYFIAGETHDSAFMFVPSESIFADLHEHFDELVQEAYRSRVVIVSPALLMLSIQVIQALLKDARMREQAHLIRDEVAALMLDVGRLDDRVRKLQAHFASANKDVEDILVSSRKITGRGERIGAIDLRAPAVAAEHQPDLLAGK